VTIHSFPDGADVIAGGREAVSADRRVQGALPVPFGKIAFDKAFALIALVLLAPVFVVVALAIVIADGGPVLFAQERVGRNGRIFHCLKFRSMVLDAEARLGEALDRDPALKQEWLETRKLRNDPRINAIGRFLRKTSLDELPQFWNVLWGDMSMVGPRPVVPSELPLYGRHVADYTSVRPGLTGAWQVSGRSNTTYAERVALDVEYIRTAGMRRDLQIVARTVRVVLGGDGVY